jgi:adenine-specific DNA-methyltransferase
LPGKNSYIPGKKEQAVIAGVSKRNTDYFEKEAEKPDGRAEDLKPGLEREISDTMSADIDKLIKETRRLSFAALTLRKN